jgi:threonine dehydratase
MNQAIDDLLPNRDELRQARERIAEHVKRTPVLRSATLNDRLDAEVFCKCENFQRGGAFKFRGAVNAVLSLSETQAARGVVTHSSGNHGQALALAARIRGIAAVVIVPDGASTAKLEAIEGYGAEVIRCGDSQSAREQATAAVAAERGCELIHPYDDRRIIAGAASAAAELIEDQPELDLILVPVGGGGLASGTALAAQLHHRLRVVGVEPDTADDARRSIEAGRLIRLGSPPITLADGLRTSLSPRTFRALMEFTDGVVCVSEAAIVEAMRFVWERMKIVIEPSSAVPLAALLSGVVEARKQRVGVILSGGNV